MVPRSYGLLQICGSFPDLHILQARIQRTRIRHHLRVPHIMPPTDRTMVLHIVTDRAIVDDRLLVVAGEGVPGGEGGDQLRSLDSALPELFLNHDGCCCCFSCKINVIIW